MTSLSNTASALGMVLVACVMGCSDEQPPAGWQLHEGFSADASSLNDAGAVVCADPCTIDIPSQSSTCPFDVDWSQSRFGVTVPSTNDELHVGAHICSPSGWVLHIGDSPSNDGYGGDGGDFSNDAEIQFVATTLTIYGSDRSVDDSNHVRTFDDAIAAQGCTDAHLVIGDGHVSVDPPGMDEHADDLLRVGADDAEGRPDRKWWVGMNRTYARASRSGHGLRRLTLCFAPRSPRP